MTALDDARSYIGQRFGPTYESWMLLSDAQAQKTLVSSADLLNHLPWQGTPTGVLDGNPTSLAWPRTGVVVDGVPVDPLTIPPDVIKASYELAVQIKAKPALVNQVDQGTNIKRVGGGGAPEVEFFVPQSARLGTATRLPPIVESLIAKYLASPSASSEGGFGSAGNDSSSFGSGQQFNLILP